MNRMLIGATAALACLLLVSVTAAPARALVVAMPNGAQKLAQSDTIVVGQVMAFEGQDVELPVAPGNKATVKYRVALVRTAEVLKGKEIKKMVRVGYQVPPQGNQPVVNPNPNVPQPLPAIRPGFVRPGGGYALPSLKVGQNGLFFLNKHASEDFYTLPMSYNFINTQDANYANELKTTRVTLKVLDNPMAGLESKDQAEKLMTVKVLLEQYRTFQGSQQQTPVEAKESQLILKAILDAEWPDNYNNVPGQDVQMHPWFLFNRLGLQPKDGWTYPRGNNTPAGLNAAAKEWLTKNWKTYQVQKYAQGPGGQVGGPIRIQPVPQPLPIRQPIKINVKPVQVQPGKIQIQPVPVQGRPVQIQVQPIRGVQVQVDPAVIPVDVLPVEENK